jgi:hypothetical protein
MWPSHAKSQRADLLKRPLADAGDVHNILDGLKGAVGLTILNDSLRRLWPDARQCLQLGRRGRIDVHWPDHRSPTAQGW